MHLAASIIGSGVQVAKRKQGASLRCPTCRTLVLRSDPEYPFCSERCRVIDLGKWASGGYVISTPVSDPDDLDAIGYQGSKSERGPEQQHPILRKDVQ